MVEEVDNNDGTGNQDDDAIYEATISCLNILNSLTKQADSSATLSPGKTSERSVQDAAFLGDMARSFNIWINYTGALADLSRCLDFRLKGHDDIRDMALELLQMLERNLEYVETRDSNHGLEEEATESIRQAVNELHFMAGAIRRSSVRSQNFMLSSAFEKSDDSFFENSAVLIIKNTFPRARRSLCKQIGASLALRRKRLLRQMQHEQKLGTRRQPTKETVIKVEAPGDPVVALQPLPPQPETLPVRLQTSQAKARGIRTRSVDTRSHMDAGMARHRIAKGPTLSTISTGSSVRLSSREYPPKPDFPEGAGDCQCPYCARRLPTAKLKNHSTFWDDHLDEDVQPYVCLSEDCTVPLLFFVGMKQWVDHMNSVHSKQWNRKIHMSTWYCDIGHEETHQFDDLESFIAHMKAPESHPDRQPPSDLQIDTLSRTKQRILIREDEYSCLLCDCVPDKLKPIIPTSDHETILYELHKHIASHIKDLAPLSVPRIDAMEERGKEVSEADDQERGRRLKDGEKASYPSGFDELVQAISLSSSSGSPAHTLLPQDPLNEIEDVSGQDEHKEGKTPITPAPAIEEWDFVFEPPRGYPKDFPSPEDDETIRKFRKARANIIAIPDLVLKHTTGRYSDAEVEEISQHLQRQGRKDWALHPRLYIVLLLSSGTDGLTHMDDFVKRGYGDIWFPYREHELPNSLDPGATARLIRDQDAVLAKEPTVKNGVHVNLADGELESVFDIGERLGAGDFGEVFTVKRRTDGQPYALKRIRRQKAFQMGRKYFMGEIQSLTGTVHHHIIWYIGSFATPTHVGTIVSPIAECNLETFLVSAQQQNDKRSWLWTYFGCLAHALRYLHYTRYVFHNDIKPSNILVRECTVLLTGFGLAYDWSMTVDSRSITMTREYQTVKYCAPEVAKQKSTNDKSDIFSLGCVFLEIMTVLRGEWLQTMNTFFRNNGKGAQTFSGNLQATSLWIQRLKSTKGPQDQNRPFVWIEQMLEKDPKRRPNAKQLVELIWSPGHDSDQSTNSTKFHGICCTESGEEMVFGANPSRDAITALDEELLTQLTALD